MKHLRNEKGIALVMVLILSLIALAIVAALVYLVTQGTKFSGEFKRYETAREAGLGGAEIAGALVHNRGEMDILGLGLTNSCSCGDPDVVGDNTFSDGTAIPAGDPYECLCAKLCDPTYTGATYNWGVCTDGTTFDPTTGADMTFPLTGLGGITYTVDAKIINTTLGNSDLSGEDLGGTSVVSSTAGVIPTPPAPYLYRIEINSQNNASVLERSRLSVLYAY
ncbi:MAG: hypothetical protein RDU01_06640 [Thermodesulfovibrionales bacterium]|nr:hypothetical protein [Thermodesulfovibrionales bacterium]